MSSDKADAPVAGDERIHLVTIDWARGKWSGVPGKYSRELPSATPLMALPF